MQASLERMVSTGSSTTTRRRPELSHAIRQTLTDASPPARGVRSPSQKWLRIVNVVQHLRSGTVNAARLAELCGVTRRQIFRDLRLLKEADLVVDYDTSRLVYQVYSDPVVYPSTATAEETLVTAIVGWSLGDPQHGIPMAQAMRTYVGKMIEQLRVSEQDRIKALLPYVVVDAGPRVETDADHFRVIVAALGSRRKLRIEGRCHETGQPLRTLLSPYGLCFRQYRWHVVGRSSCHRRVAMLRVGDLSRVETVEETFEIPQRFNLRGFLQHGEEVHAGRHQPCRVVVHFSAALAREVTEVRWPTEPAVERLPDGSVRLSMNVNGLEDVTRWILGFGEQATVLSPHELRQTIGKHARAMVRLYDDDPVTT
jgi:predicted DNA-binding transcriptional regulator YafY